MFTFGFNIDSKISGGISYDADASAFFTAASITDTTQKNAVNQLVLDLKSANIWTKFKAVYPFVGGTSTSHKFNLVNPADSDAAFRLSFSTGWTHDSTGALPNGSSAYANTFLNTQTVFTSNTLSIGGYTKFYTSFVNTNYLIGATSGGRTAIQQSTSILNYAWINTAIATTNATSYTFYNGFLSTTRSATNNLFSLNSTGTTFTTNSTTPTQTLSNAVSYIGAMNNSGTAQGFFRDYINFIYYSDVLTQAEVLSLRTAVINFETTLSRN